jgi:aryl-alcohol dehydrogenase-like predicted oxidoreductase
MASVDMKRTQPEGSRLSAIGISFSQNRICDNCDMSLFPVINTLLGEGMSKQKIEKDMNLRRLSRKGPEVSALGLGCMGMSDFYGPADENESIATIHASLDAGITLLDTGDFYGMGHNEMLIREALKGRPRDQVILSVKFGGQRGPDGSFLGMDNRPASVKNFLAYTLRRLGTDYIDIYRPARVDPQVPIEETAGAIAEMIKAGYVRWFGLSEAGVDTIRRAHATHPVVDLQIEYSLLDRGVEDRIIPTLRELGIGLTAYGVLSRGLLSGAKGESTGDFRAHLPRFQGDNLAHNLKLVDALRKIAEEKKVTVPQLAIAWVLSRGGDIVPLIGARRRERLTEALGAFNLELTPDDLGRIEMVVPSGAVAGTRYPAEHMAMLDSER